MDRRSSTGGHPPRPHDTAPQYANYPDVMRPGSFRSSLYEDPYRGSSGRNRADVNNCNDISNMNNDLVNTTAPTSPPQTYPSNNAHTYGNTTHPVPPLLQKSSLLRSSSRKSVRFADDSPVGVAGVNGEDSSTLEAKKRVHFAEHDQLAYLESASAVSDLSGSDVRDDVSRTSSDVTNNEYVIQHDDHLQYSGVSDLGSGQVAVSRGGRDPSFEISDTDQTHNHSPPMAVFGGGAGAGTGRYPPPDVAFGNFRPEDGSLV